MTFLDNLEDKIRAAYLKILERKYPLQIQGKTLRCDSFRIIAIEIKRLINDAKSKEITTVFDITNFIIFNLLQADYFIYENHIMSLFIGHLFLENRGVTHKFSLGNINNISTIKEISVLTASWGGINGT
jgi:prophage maintenance system killer protein